MPETPVGLNADPCADTEFPGVTIVTEHDWLGCPVIPAGCGFPATAVLPSAQHKAAPTSVVINLVFIPINRNDRGRALHRKGNAVVTFADSPKGDSAMIPQNLSGAEGSRLAPP